MTEHGNEPSDDRCPSATLLRRSRAPGAERALDELLALHLPDLRAFVRLNADARIRHHESNSDVVQSVCREALQNADRFEYRDERGFKNWLYGAVLNKIRDRRRYWQAERRRPDRELSEREDGLPIDVCTAYARFTPSRIANGREELARVEAAFEHLSDSQRRILTLARIVGLSHAEIAAELDMNEGAVRVALHRALVKLSAVLAE